MGWTTHEVTNQVPDLVDYNLFDADTVLREAVMREGADDAAQALSDYGGLLGQDRIIALAEELDRDPPRLRPYDRQGRRIDEVVHPAGWHEFLAMGWAPGLNAPVSPARAAAFLLHGQIEVADAFIAVRLGPDDGMAGMAASPTALDSVPDRAWGAAD